MTTITQTLKNKGYMPVILLVFALTITICITIFFGLTIKELLQTQFERRTASVIRSLNNRVQSHSFLLKGIQSIMESDPNFTQEEFNDYLQRFLNPAIYPGLIQAGYQGDTTFSLSYKKNVPPDLRSNNQGTLKKATDTGTFTSAIYKNTVLIVYLPVYRSDALINTVAERRDAIEGFAYVAIDIRSMLNEVMLMQNDIGFKLQTEPYYTTSSDHNELSILDMKRNITYQFFDREWPITLTMYPNKEFLDHIIFLVIIVLFGITCSLFTYQVSLRQYKSQKKADSLERQKDEFVAIASHELKTPLTSIKALNQLLAEKLLSESNPLYESYFRKTDSQIKRMEHLINDLLDVSKIRAGKLHYNKDWFDLEATVRTVCDEIQDVKKSHQITINGSLTHQVFGDKERIAQLITNLLTNAAKYSPQANVIIVSMKETVKEAIISIKDFGIGITNDNQKKIFERFYRVTTDERKFKGMGIGLFISSEIIQKHGGRIWVKSTKSKGSTFYFSLPLEPVDD